MARDAEAKKLTPWADSGDRQDPEDAGLDREIGWTVAYEQAGSGNSPERLKFSISSCASCPGYSARPWSMALCSGARA